MTGLAETYSSVRETLEADSATAAAAVAGDTKTPPGKSGTNAHTLEGHRQTMAGVVPRLYQLLSNAVEADDARKQSQEMSSSYPGAEMMAGTGVASEGIRAVLHGKPWLWVGDAFVPADQARLSFCNGFCSGFCKVFVTAFVGFVQTASFPWCALPCLLSRSRTQRNQQKFPAP